MINAHFDFPLDLVFSNFDFSQLEEKLEETKPDLEIFILVITIVIKNGL
jgi:hypothetical protein